MTSSSSIITLITDFGHSDTYVGQMKGVIAGIHPNVTMIDLTHEVLPQNIAQAAWHLVSAVDAFPSATVHLIVVDPGVGSTRRIVAAEAEQARFVCPDNGLLTPIQQRCGLTRVVHVQDAKWFRDPVSDVFHGRDVMAPVAAHLARGTDLGAFGPELPVDELVRLPPHELTRRTGHGAETVISAAVVHIDRFGNAITSLHRDDTSGSGGHVRVPGHPALRVPLHTHYAAGTSQQLMALFGSGQRLELAVPNGSAADSFCLSVGDVVEWWEAIHEE